MVVLTGLEPFSADCIALTERRRRKTSIDVNDVLYHSGQST